MDVGCWMTKFVQADQCLPLLFPTPKNCSDCAVSSSNVNDHLMRQYGACVVDSLVLGITCILHHYPMCTSHPDIFHYTNLLCPLSVLNMILAKASGSESAYSYSWRDIFIFPYVMPPCIKLCTSYATRLSPVPLLSILREHSVNPAITDCANHEVTSYG